MLFLHPSDEMYGADRSLRSLVLAVREIARPVVILPTDLPYRGALSTSLIAEGVEVLVGPLPVVRRRYLSPKTMIPWAIRSLMGTLWLVRVARSQKAVGIVSNTTAVIGGPIAAGLLRVPHMWYVREIVEEPGWYRAVVRGTARLAGGSVVAVSTAVATWLGPIPAHGPQVIRNCVDIDAAPVGLPARPRALFVGRLNAWKGHDTFIDAAALAHEVVPEATFALVGGSVPGDETTLAAVKARVRGLDPEGSWIDVVGELPDSRAAMRDAWVVAVPSVRPDPFPNVVLEAMAEGRAVVGSESGGIPEMIDAGTTGELVQPGDVDDLGSALARVLGDRKIAESMGAAGRARAEAEFSRQRYTAVWQAAFTEMFLRGTHG